MNQHSILDNWLHPILRGERPYDKVLFRWQNELLFAQDNRIVALEFEGVTQPRPQLALRFHPKMRKFIGRSLGLPIDSQMILPVVWCLEELDTYPDSNIDGIIRCVLADWALLPKRDTLRLRDQTWICRALSRAKPPKEFIALVKEASVIGDPVLGLARLLKPLSPIDEMLDLANTYGFPKGLLGGALNHLDKFRTL